MFMPLTSVAVTILQIYAFASIDYSKCPANKKNIRGKILIGGWYFAPHATNPNICQVTMVSVCDPCRSVPSALAKSTAERSGKSMALFRKAIESREAAILEAGGDRQNFTGYPAGK